MEFIQFPASERSAFASVAANMDLIRKAAETIVDALSQRSDEVETLKRAGFEIRVLTGRAPEMAEVETPLGRGAVTLGWRIKGGALVGHLRFEKFCTDEYNKSFRKLVWALTIPAHSPPYSSPGSAGFQLTQSTFDDDLKTSYFDMLGSVYAAYADFDLSVIADEV